MTDRGSVDPEVARASEVRHQLAERRKELTCLHQLAELLQTCKSVEEWLSGAVSLLPPAWQHPDIARARIVLDGRECRSEQFQQTAWMQSANLELAGETAGTVEIYYSEERPDLDEGPFLKEERLLIETIARTLSAGIENLRAQDALRTSAAQLEESQARLQLALKASKIGLWDVDLTTGEALLTPEMKMQLGYQDDEFEGSFVDWRDRLHPDDRESTLRKLQDHLDGDTPFVATDCRLRHRDGSFRWMHMHGEALRDDSGRPIRLTGSQVDITKRVQEDIRFREMVETLPLGIAFTKGESLSINSEAEHILGYERSELSTLDTWFRKLYGNDHELVRRLYEEDKAAGFVEAREARLHRKDGEVRIVEFRGLLSERGDVWIFQDITERRRSEEALRASENRLKHAEQLAGVGYMEWDIRSNRMVWSDQTFRIHGLEPGAFEPTLETTMKFGHPDDHEKINKAVEIALEGKAAYDVEHRNIRADGQVIHVHARGEVTFDETNRPVRLLGMVMDITDRRKTEAALKESHGLFSDIVETSQDIIWVVDREGRHIYINPAIEATIGRPPEEFIGKSSLASMHPEDRARVQNLLPKWIEEKTGWQNLVIRWRHRDGSWRWLQSSSVPFFDREGNLAGFRGVDRDITERRKTLEDLRRSIEKFSGIVEHVGVGIALISPDMRVLERNTRFQEYFPDADFTRHQKCFRTCCIPPREEPCDDCPALLSLRDGLTHEAIVRIPHDGDPRQFRIVASPIKDSDGKVSSVIEVVEDVTDKLQAEESLRQSQKLEALGTLAGGIAHDFNNLLYVILGNADHALSATPEGSEAHSCLTELADAGKRATDLVSHILTFSRRGERQLEPHDIQTLLKENAAFLRKSLPSTIEMRVDFDPDCGYVLADQTEIHQVIVNLCTNASHAMRDNGGTLTLRLKRVEVDRDAASKMGDLEAGSHARLTVVDTGHGMDEHTLSRATEPFFTTKGVGEGTGMGLPMVHGIVSRMQGGLFLESSPGDGTTAQVYLPLCPEVEKTAPPDEEDLIPDSPEGNESILFVDDEEAINRLAVSALGDLGYKVSVFSNSLEALEAFTTRPDDFDVIVTDQTMPNMIGTKLAEEILRIRPDIPIFVCTGYSNTDIGAENDIPGIREFLQKPLDMHRLCRSIRRALDSSATVRGG